jgi:surface protein
MAGMFRGAVSFNQDISNWDVSKVTRMNLMFNGALSFDQNLGDWFPISVTNFSSFLTDAVLSVTNYDSTIVGWAEKNLQPNLTFDAGESKYTTISTRPELGPGSGPRGKIINEFGWTINDGGLYEPRKVAEITFDEGNAINYASSQNGVIVDAEFTKDRFNNSQEALSLNGQGEYVNFSDSSDFKFGYEDFTVSFWYNYSGNSVGNILGKQAPRDGYQFVALPDSNGQLQLDLKSNNFSLTSSAREIFKVSVPKNQWTNIIYIHKVSDEGMLIVNGDTAAVKSFNNDLFRGFDGGSAPFLLGAESSFITDFFEGYIDDINLYNYAISSQEVDSLWGGYIPTSNEPISTSHPNEFRLEQNYPNPFNPSTTISYTLAQSTKVTIQIYDTNGRLVSTLIDNKQQVSGKHRVQYNAASLASGVYFYQIKSPVFTQTKKFTLIK